MKFTPLRIALIYFVFAFIWIATTDWLLGWFLFEPEMISIFQTSKGLFYISVTAVGLYWMIRSYEHFISRDQLKLKDYERSLNLALSSASMATWEYFVKPDRYLNSENHNELFGLEKEFGLNLDSIFEIIHHEDLPGFKKAAEKTLKTGDDFDVEYRIVKPGNEIRWLWTKGTAIQKNGTVEAVSGVTVDITDKKNLQEKLSLEKEKFEKLFGKIPVLITVFDPEINVTRVNEEFEKVLGWKENDRVEKNLMELCYPDPKYRMETEKFMRKPDKGWKEFDVVSKSGEIKKQMWTNIRLADDTVVGIGYDVTERKELENRVKEDKEELQLIFDNMPVFIIIHDGQDEGVGKVNKFFKERLGYQEELASGKDLLKLITTEEGYKKAVRSMQSSESGWEDYELIARDGSRLQTTWTNIKLSDKKSIGIGLDITGRKEIEEKLKEKEQRLHLATTSANVGLWEWCPQTGDVVFDEMWAALVGYTLEELEPVSIETWNELVHPDDLIKFEHEVERYFSGETDIYECEVRMKHKKGHWVWILDRGRTVEWDQEGRPHKLVGTHVDITDRMEYEKENQLLANVFRKSNTGLSVSNHTTNELERVNQAYADLYGYDVEEMIGMDVSKLYAPDFRIDPVREVEIAERAGQTTFESVLQRKDGSTFSAIVNLVIVQDDENEFDYRISTIQDISEQKNQEAELRISRNQLLQAQKIANMGYWNLDLGTKELWWSDIVYEIYERDKETFQPDMHSYIEQIFPEDREYVQKAMEEQFKGESFELNHRIVKSDGKVGYVQVRGEKKAAELTGREMLAGSVLDVTEIKEIEQRLEEEQKRFEVAANLTSDVIWEWNPEKNQLWWGEGIGSVFGYKKEDYENVPRFWQNHIVPEDRENVSKSMEAAEKSDDLFWSCDYHFLAADGSRRKIHDSAVILRDDAGEIIRIIGAMVDVTELEEYQEALKHQSYKFEMIAKSSNDVLYEWNIETDEIWWNEGWTTHFDYAETEIETDLKWWIKKLHPDDIDMVSDSLNRAVKKNLDSWSIQYRMLNGWGEYSIVVDKGYFIKDDEGKNAFLIGTISDITTDIETRESLKASEEQYRLLFMQSPLPMWIYDPETLHFITANQSAIEKYGYSEDELKGMKIYELHPETELKLIKEEIARSIKKRRTGFDVWTQVTKNGDKLIAEISGSEIYYEGKIHRLIIANDITMQRKAEERAISAIIEGEERERHRIAKDLHDGLGQYLSAANMNLETVYEDAHQIPEKLSLTFKRGLDLLKHAILETRTISQNLLPKAIQDYGLELAIDSLISQLKNTHDITFYLYTSVGSLEIPDKIQINMYRIMQESLNNAIRHGKPSKINIHLVYSDGELLLTIEDNGSGFDTNKSYGDGVGIRSMKTRVAAMSANIDITSTLGEGTVISIAVPI